MQDARPGQISSLAAFLVTGMATGSFAAELPKRAMPFFVDPLRATEQMPLAIGKMTPSDWIETQALNERKRDGVRLAYQSYNLMCRRNISECAAAGEMHCDVTTFGKSVYEAGKWELVQGATKSQECVSTSDLRHRQNNRHTVVRFDGPPFDITGPISAFDTLPAGLISP